MNTKILEQTLQLSMEEIVVFAQQAEDNYIRFPLDKGNGKKRWIEAPKRN